MLKSFYVVAAEWRGARGAARGLPASSTRVNNSDMDSISLCPLASRPSLLSLIQSVLFESRLHLFYKTLLFSSRVISYYVPGSHDLLHARAVRFNSVVRIRATHFSRSESYVTFSPPSPQLQLNLESKNDRLLQTKRRVLYESVCVCVLAYNLYRRLK